MSSQYVIEHYHTLLANIKQGNSSSVSDDVLRDLHAEITARSKGITRLYDNADQNAVTVGKQGAQEVVDGAIQKLEGKLDEAALAVVTQALAEAKNNLSGAITSPLNFGLTRGISTVELELAQDKKLVTDVMKERGMVIPSEEIGAGPGKAEPPK